MGLPDPDNLPRRIEEALRSRTEILEAYLFGSRARQDSHALSDIDVAVFLDRSDLAETAFGYRAELASSLMTALATDAVDVVILNEAPPLLYHRVLRDGIRLFSRDLAATTTREGRALSRYCDYAVQLRKIDAAHSARIAAGAFGR
jgi:predicted nucleotidyltransferase